MNKLLSALVVFMLLPAFVVAQEPLLCEFEYTVQAGDWLSKIAEKYYGDPLAYDQLVVAANTDDGDAFTNIDDPDLIEPGWMLCIPPDGDPNTGPQPVPEGTGPDQAGQTRSETGLTGTLWLLDSLNGQPPLSDAPVTATFEDGNSLTGSSGCNSYSTTYETGGDSLTINPVMAATMMACPEPIMQQEQTYLAALNATSSYQINGQQLQLQDSDGNSLASFSAQQPVAPAGSGWRVITYKNGNQGVVSVIIGTELTANFGADGTLKGSAGCNDYSATYQVNGETISVGPAAVTRKFCGEPEGIMEQESQYLAALETATTYKIELNRMEMRSADGALVANFERMKPVAEATVSGTVTYLQRMALPPDAVVNVQLQDTSLADVPATVIGEQIIPTNGQQVPIPFEVAYDPAAIESNHTYTLRARIEDSSGQLLFINTTAYPVITNDNPAYGIEVVVEPVG